jgi:hypothetical protein
MLRKITTSLLALTLAIVTLPIQALDTNAAPVRGNAQSWVWARTDMPVAQGVVNRTWMWGPEAMTGQLAEEYDDSPGGSRVVQYFDKSRMEITDPAGDAGSPWYVTNGLLALELITARVQVGDSRFEHGSPAHINVAGDSNDPQGPTYYTFSGLLDHQPLPLNSTIVQTVNRAGNVESNASLGRHGVTAAYHVPETNHTVASVFWDFMNSEGIIESGSVDGPDVARLFENPFYATGLPITEAYWTNVRVAGEQRQVLVQAFERRVLTYTPGNPPGWEVEAGNVGRHYYHWRYGDLILPGTEGQPYYTQFEDWPTGTLDAGSAYHHSFGYRFNVVPGPGAGLIAMAPGETFRDVQFNLGLQRTGGSLDSIGCLVTRYDPQSTGSYRFCIDGHGRTFAEIGRMGAEQFDVYQTVLEPAVRHGTLPSDQENKLLVFTYGQDTWFAINGHLIGSIRDPDPPLYGQAGVKVMNFGDTSAEWQFNYLQTRNIVP